MRAGILDPAASPGARVTRQRVEDYRDLLRTVGADNTIAGRVQGLGNALKALEPQGDSSWILRAAARLSAKAVLVRDPVDRMQPVEAVVKLGQDLFDAAEHHPFRTPCERATLFRDGLIIGFLARRALRMSNLRGLMVGDHLENREGRWAVRIRSHETKNGQEIHFSWPDDLIEALERYLGRHRLELLKCATKKARNMDALWISKQGTDMTTSAILYQVNARTKEVFGKSINPHTFRHIAATTVATSDPSSIMDVPDVLGHGSMAASEKHYNRARMLAAGDALQTTIANLRRRRDPAPDRTSDV